MDTLPLDVFPNILSNLSVTFDFKNLNLTNKFFNNLITKNPQFRTYRRLVNEAIIKFDEDYMTNLIERLYSYVKAPNKHKRKVKTSNPPGRGADVFGVRSCYFSKSDEVTRQMKISWWEFLFLVACEKGNDLSLDLIANYPIIKEYFHNIHLGFVMACHVGSFRIVKGLYDVGMLHEVDLYLHHFCDNTGIFCRMEECGCHNNLRTASSLVTRCIQNKSIDILQWCIDTSRKNKYSPVVNKYIPEIFSMKLHNTKTFGLNRTFIQQCLAGRHEIANMIYQHNISNQIPIGYFAPALLLKSCHDIICNAKIQFIQKVSTIELLLQIFVTHYGETVESDDEDINIEPAEEEEDEFVNPSTRYLNEP